MILGACLKNKHTLPLMQIKPRTNPAHSAAALPKHVTIARHMNPETYVQEKAAASGSSFYYAFLFLPANRRAAITAFYAFCREVDDVVDEVQDVGVAAQKLACEKPGQTLEATALVHEAYVRLVDVERAQHWNSRGHFFAACAEAMVAASKGASLGA